MLASLLFALAQDNDIELGYEVIKAADAGAAIVVSGVDKVSAIDPEKRAVKGGLTLNAARGERHIGALPGIVITAMGEKLIGYDTDLKTKKWEVTIEGTGQEARPPNLILFQPKTAKSAILNALIIDPATGQTKTRIAPPFEAARALRHPRLLIFSEKIEGTGPKFAAYSDAGDLKWQAETPKNGTLSLYTRGAATVADKAVDVFDFFDFKPGGKLPLPKDHSFIGLADELAVFAKTDPNGNSLLKTVSWKTGKDAWELTVQGAARHAEAVSGRVIVTTSRGVFSLAAADGARQWHQPKTELFRTGRRFEDIWPVTFGGAIVLSPTTQLPGKAATLIKMEDGTVRQEIDWGTPIRQHLLRGGQWWVLGERKLYVYGN